MIKKTGKDPVKPFKRYEGIERDADKRNFGPDDEIGAPEKGQDAQADTEHGPGVNPDGTHKKF